MHPVKRCPARKARCCNPAVRCHRAAAPIHTGCLRLRLLLFQRAFRRLQFRAQRLFRFRQTVLCDLIQRGACRDGIAGFRQHGFDGQAHIRIDQTERIGSLRTGDSAARADRLICFCSGSAIFRLFRALRGLRRLCIGCCARSINACAASGNQQHCTDCRDHPDSAFSCRLLIHGVPHPFGLGRLLSCL